jgi:cob(I)alamin adenosyltransferase
MRSSPTELFAQAIQQACFGQSIAIYQLLKGGINQGVSNPTQISNINWYRAGIEHCIHSYSKADLEAVQTLWRHAQSSKADLIILDEMGLAIELGYIAIEEAIKFKAVSLSSVVLVGVE